MRQTTFEVKRFLCGVLLRYVRAYLILMVVTFVEIFAGLAILRVQGAALIAAIIAVADLLPAIGTGLIMVPWGTYLILLGGDPFLGSGILILFGIEQVVRNILEPKVVGDQIGLSPLVTITAMFFGLKVLGFWGLFFMPILILTLKFLNDNGTLHLWKP